MALRGPLTKAHWDVARRRTLAAAMMWPTLFVAAVWIGSGWAPSVQPRWRSAGWDWRLGKQSIQLRQTYPPVPVTTLPAGTVPPGWGASPNSGSRSYLFGWIGVYHGGIYNTTMCQRTRAVYVNYFIPLMITLPLAWAGARLWRRPTIEQRRYRLGLCVNCGYNLTGNASGVCPECGTAIQRGSGQRAAGSGERATKEEGT